MNYQTATKEEIFSVIDLAIRSVAKSLEDSPISRSRRIFNHIGFFEGVMVARGFDYDYEEILNWLDLV